MSLYVQNRIPPLLLHLRIILIKVLITDTNVQFIIPSVVDLIIYKRAETAGRSHLRPPQRLVSFLKRV